VHVQLFSNFYLFAEVTSFPSIFGRKWSFVGFRCTMNCFIFPDDTHPTSRQERLACKQVRDVKYGNTGSWVNGALLRDPRMISNLLMSIFIKLYTGWRYRHIKLTTPSSGNKLNSIFIKLTTPSFENKLNSIFVKLHTGWQCWHIKLNPPPSSGNKLDRISVGIGNGVFPPSKHVRSRLVIQ
jgi:hypothetical protein